VTPQVFQYSSKMGYVQIKNILTLFYTYCNLLSLITKPKTMRKSLLPVITVIIVAGFWTCTYAQETGFFSDTRDGKEYKTVKIGDQCWMSENLAFKTTGDCWIYEGIEDYAETYGYLYNWEAAKNVCPDGWHLPSDAEFEKLSNFLGGPDAAGGKLKEAGTTHWKSPNAGATNSSGFSALSAGMSGDNEYKGYLGLMTFFSSSDDDGDVRVVARALYSAKGEFTRYGILKEKGISVRCIKDQ